MATNNLLLMFDNHLDQATLAASSAETSMPVTNLQDPRRGVVWRSSGTTGSEYINITRPDPGAGTLPAIEAVFLVDHNLDLNTSASPASRVRVQSWADALDGATPGASFWTFVWTGFTAPAPGGLIRKVMAIVLPTSYTHRYWRISMENQAATYCQLGRICMGPIWQPIRNMGFGTGKKIAPRTRSIESRSGAVYGNPQSGRLAFDLELKALSDSEAQDLMLNSMLVEDHTPIAACLSPAGAGVTGKTHTLTSIYGTLSPYETSDRFINLNRATVRLTEAL